MNQTKALMIGGGIVLLGVGFFVYKKIKAKKDMEKYSMGSDVGNNNGNIPSNNSNNSNTSNTSNYNPQRAAKNIKKALEYWMGTDEDLFWDTANSLNTEQKKLVVDYFNTNYGDLKDWIEGDFSFGEEKKALRVFNL